MKLENEVVKENLNASVDEVNNLYHEELLKNQQPENIIENISEQSEVSFSKEVIDTTKEDQNINSNLKEFGVDTDEPDLFSHNTESSDSQDLLDSSQDHNEEDDLEIPAFLRRQKN